MTFFVFFKASPKGLLGILRPGRGRFVVAQRRYTGKYPLGAEILNGRGVVRHLVSARTLFCVQNI